MLHFQPKFWFQILFCKLTCFYWTNSPFIIIFSMKKKISSGKNQNIIEHYVIYLPLTFPFCLISPPLMGHLSYLHGPNQNLFNFDHALYSVLGILIPKHMISMPWIRCFEYLNSIIFYHLSIHKVMQRDVIGAEKSIQIPYNSFFENWCKNIWSKLKHLFNSIILTLFANWCRKNITYSIQRCLIW